MKSRIHVNQHAIRANTKHNGALPVITCKDYKRNRKGHEAEIVVDGDVVARVVYSPDKPLACGARVWVETEHEVRVLVRQA